MIYSKPMSSENSKSIAERYLTELRKPSRGLSSEDITHYSQQAVALFFHHFNSTGNPLREAIELLCEINSLPDRKLSRIGLEALFPYLIEKLNDSFEPVRCKLYDQLFAQVISFCRQLPECRQLDFALTQFHLPDETSLLARKNAITNSAQFLTRSRPLKKILVLSRVTIGADVAITSVLISGLKQQYPHAEIVLIGPSKLEQLYGGEPSLRILPFDYGRKDDLFSRLNHWHYLVEVVTNEIAGMSGEEFCIIDPDSRLTQLGLLPIIFSHTELHNYYFFESRTFSRPGLEKLGQLASKWLNEICGNTGDYFPFVSLVPETLQVGKDLARFLKYQKKQRLISLSFGVGGNPSKRISEQFEMKLVQLLTSNNKLIIDCGSTIEENEQVTQILNFLQSNGKSILSLNEQHSQPDILFNQSLTDIISWQGGVGSFASLIAASDQYIGYDSSGQHIAAASAVPTLTLFVNSGSPTFSKRWEPYGTVNVQVIHIEPSHLVCNDEYLDQLLRRASSYL